MAHPLSAFEIQDTAGWVIEPAAPRRDWMDQTIERVAYRCLPLVIANQMGWIVRSPATFSATWDGGQGADALRVSFAKGFEQFAPFIASHFGSGILTFHIPWLFRTPAGWGMIARGPTNWIKDNIAALDGFIETDWAPYTFTMNWKVLRRSSPVWFQKGDPVCMLMPYPVAALEEFEPAFRQLADDPDLDEDYSRWSRGRAQRIRDQHVSSESPFSGDYTRGRRPDGEVVTEHRASLRLRPFQPR